jgi:HipA-like C-terminal domain
LPKRPYPIERVLPEWALEHEEMGSKTKFWYHRPGGRFVWLFKYPHTGTGEHWAEKIAAEIAARLDIPHAQTKLAICDGVPGSSSRSFVRAREGLFHGNQEMAGALDWYEPERKFHQSDHTLANIFATIDKIFMEPTGRQLGKSLVADYLVLDALVGNTDRHHENWGTLRLPGKHVDFGRIAPSFDHASSLGRELHDFGERRTRQRLIVENRIGAYSERARGGIFWSSCERHAPSPLELIRRAAQAYPDEFRVALNRLRDLTAEDLSAPIARVPLDWMSNFAKQFALELMCYNLEELRKLLR